MRKPRSDSKLMNLPEEQKAQLCDWLLSGVPYHLVKALLKKEFDVVSSLGALSGFYEAYCAAELIARRRRAVTTADEIASEAEKKPGRFDLATIDALKQKAFELSISRGADPRDVKSLFMLVLKARDQDLSERELRLTEEKFQVEVCEKFLAWFKSDQARQIAESGLSKSDQIKELRQAFFADIDAMEKSGKVQLPS